MTFEQLLDSLFPKSLDLGMPSFSELGTKAADDISAEIADGVTKLLAEVMLCGDAELLEINALVKRIRRKDSILLDAFLTKVLEIYFSHETVVKALRPESVTLFPHYRPLEDIDFELLFPVMDITIGDYR
jgi:hypothetical protein